MIIHNNTNPDQALQQVFKEIRKGASDSRHPFRFLSFSTINPESGEPNIRMVVLRAITPNWETIIYTDARTSKINELQQSSRAALLFWHGYHKTQVTLKVNVALHHDDEFARQYWKKDVHGPAQKAYTPLVSPGTEISSPEEAYRWPDEYSSEHFCVLACHPYEVEVLQINKKNHRRLLFQRNTPDDDWQAQWIAP